MFEMIALIDYEANINILNMKNIPAKYWVTAEREVVGLGNKKLRYEVPKASVCFESHCIYMKFAIADILVDCILGNIFLAAVEAHGSLRLKGGKAAYFIFVPTSKGTRKKIELPYISNPRISTMVHTIQDLDRAEARLSELMDLKCTLRIEEHLKLPQIQNKIGDLKKLIEEECCYEEPNAFWHRKHHTVELPYKEGYTGKPCKSRAIPINTEYRDLCQKEIQ